MSNFGSGMDMQISDPFKNDPFFQDSGFGRADKMMK